MAAESHVAESGEGNENENSNALMMSPQFDGLSSRFQAQYKIATQLFSRDNSCNSNPKRFLSSSTRYSWDVFLIAYPSAALAMVKVQEFFRSLERRYLPFEEDENTGEPSQYEADQDQLSTPDEYFQLENGQDQRRLKSWTKLLYGDTRSDAWRRQYWLIEMATLSTERHAKLWDDLHSAMNPVEKPWPQVIQRTIEEIKRRFDDLETFLSAFGQLSTVNKMEYQQNHPPVHIGFADETDSSSSRESLAVELPDHPFEPRKPAELEGTTTAAELEGISQIHGLIRRRRQRKNRNYPNAQAIVPTVEYNKSSPTGIIACALAYFRKRELAWISVCVLPTLGGIFSAIASGRTNAAKPSNVFDSNFYTNLSTLMFSLASVIILMPKSSWDPRLVGMASSCMLIAVVANIASVVVYPYSVSVSLWASFLNQFFQLLSTIFLIEK